MNDSGDMFAGHDGSVYKKQEGGGWQKYENGGWNDVPDATPQQREQAQQARDKATSARDGASHPRVPHTASSTSRDRSSSSPTAGQLERDYAAREQGAQRTRDSTYLQRFERRRRGGSYRPSGGGGRARSGGRR